MGTRMLGLLKVIVVVAVIAVVGGLATHWVKNKATAALHHTIDTALPGKVEAHAWAPLSHGKPVGTARVRFENGTVTSVGCHTALGTYSVSINHDFSFDKAATPIKAGCPGRQLRAALTHATRVDDEAHGSTEQLTFTNKSDHVVATLQAHAR
jgi:hypothetical protein